MKYINFKAHKESVIQIIYDEIIVQTLGIKENEKILNVLNHFGENVEVKCDPSSVEFWFSDNREYTEKQLKINSALKCIKMGKNEIYVNIRGNTINPEKIIFSFPSFSVNDLECKYYISTLNNISSKALEKVCVIAFQDNYGPYGTYLQYDDNGNALKDAIINYIDLQIGNFKLAEKDCLFIGNSKGGTTASIFKYYFNDSYLIDVAGHSNLVALSNSFTNILNTTTFDFKQFGNEDFFISDIKEYNVESSEKNTYFCGSKDSGTFGLHNLITENYTIFTTNGHDIINKEINTMYALIEKFCCKFEYKEISGILLQMNKTEYGSIYEFGFDKVCDEKVVIIMDFCNSKGEIECSTTLAVSPNGAITNDQNGLKYESFLKENMYSYVLNVYDLNAHRHYKVIIDNGKINNILCDTKNTIIEKYEIRKFLYNDGLLYFHINFTPQDKIKSANTDMITKLYVYNDNDCYIYDIACNGKFQMERDIFPSGFYLMKIVKIENMKMMILITDKNEKKVYQLNIDNLNKRR